MSPPVQTAAARMWIQTFRKYIVVGPPLLWPRSGCLSVGRAIAASLGSQRLPVTSAYTQFRCRYAAGTPGDQRVYRQVAAKRPRPAFENDQALALHSNNLFALRARFRPHRQRQTE